MSSDELLTQVNIARLNNYYADAQSRIKAVTDLAMLWLKSMTVLSGGAVIGILTVLASDRASALNESDTWIALALFTCCLTLTMTALFLGYLGQDRYYNVEAAAGEELYQALTGGKKSAASNDANIGTRMTLAAIVTAIAALLAFAGGGVFGLKAVLPTGAQQAVIKPHLPTAPTPRPPVSDP